MALVRLMLATCASGAILLAGCGSPEQPAAPADAVQATEIEPATAGEEQAGAGEQPAVDLEPATGVEEAQEAAAAGAGEDASPLDAGQAFLAKNAQREGVTTTASGLQYEVLASGEGASPKATDQVRAHYHGTLIDGTVFDSSVDRGEPFETGVNSVIAGWQEALQLMKVGDKWKLVVPPELAYGERGSPPAIGPNETLVFEVELLSIES